MSSKTDVMLFGTGEFASRFLFDLSASADDPVRVTVVGRDDARLAWLRTAANARSMLFGRPARIETRCCPSFDTDSVAGLIAEVQPTVVVQTASLQTASVLRSTDNAWGRLVAEGGLSVTAPFQAALSLQIGRAIQVAGSRAHYVNACFPDVTNGLLMQAGIPVLCGVGNVAILATAFAGAMGVYEPGRLKTIAHYQQLALWRKLPEDRSGSVPRVWLDDHELGDILTTFRGVMLSPQTAFDISGATGVPLALALAAGRPWQGHVPAPQGLPGGYPVRVDEHGVMTLDLPPGLSREAAVSWNAAFEKESGLIIDEKGQALYTGRLRDELARYDEELACGFDPREIDQVIKRLAALRDRLQAQAG